MSQVEEFKTLASRVSSEIMSAANALQQGKERDGSVSSAHVEAALLSLKQTAHRLNVDAGAIAAPQKTEEPAGQAEEKHNEPVEKLAEGPVSVDVQLPAKE